MTEALPRQRAANDVTRPLAASLTRSVRASLAVVFRELVRAARH
jgi:hypothetical protein